MVDHLETYDPNGLFPDLSTLSITDEKKSTESTQEHCMVNSRTALEREKYRLPPYSNILMIESTFEEDNKKCEIKVKSSGVLIGPNHVLTAYSTIHKKDYGLAKNVKVHSNIGGLEAKMVSNHNFGINPDEEGLEYYNNADICLLILDKTLGKTLGYLPLLRIKVSKVLKEEPLHIAGYSNLITLMNNLYTSEGECKDPKKALSTGIVEYDIDTDEQQIGAPIYLEYSGPKVKTAYYVIGVQSLETNHGIILNEEKYNEIMSKINETTAK